MKKYKILYIEVDMSTAIYVENILKNIASDIVHVSKYDDAISAYSLIKPDVIITDIELDKKTGIDFIKFVRNQNDNTPVIILSSHTKKEYFLDVIDLKIEKYLIKPVNKNQLLEYFNDIENKQKNNIFNFDNNFKYSMKEKCFYHDNEKIQLRSHEIILLEELLKNPKEYYSYSKLQDLLGKKKPISIDSLRTLVKKFRQKIFPDIIINLSGIGYRINLLESNINQETNDKINILIADDNKLNLEFLNKLIMKNFKDINIFLANDGLESIDILKNNRIDIALLDIQMPKADGWDVATFIKDKLSNKNIAFIFITGFFSDEECERKGFELGAVDYIIRPIDNNQFVNRLGLYIKNFLIEKKLIQQIEQNKLQEKLLLQKEIMIAQSNILRNIAHHWRQPLSLISASSMNIELLIDNKNFDRKKIKKSCEMIDETTQSLSTTIDHFSSFFEYKDQTSLFDLKDTIVDLIKLFSFELNSEKIDVNLKLQPIQYYGNKTLFRQILISILNNCIDVLKNKKMDDRFIEIELIEQSGNINISIIDNGGGIDTEIQDKVYEPYFTTKHQHAGIGISLYLAHQLIGNYFNGLISNENINCSFENKDYKCTKFILDFKINDKKV